jgi:hypothetical protein
MTMDVSANKVEKYAMGCRSRGVARQAVRVVAVALVVAACGTEAEQDDSVATQSVTWSPGTAFVRVDEARFRAVVPPSVHANAGAATVTYPVRANDAVELRDDATDTRVRFSLRGAAPVRATTANGLVTYARALRGADLVQRPRVDGTEDFVAFASRPAREELVYDVDLVHVAGLRLVANTLEFLDERGTPRLRVAPPYVVEGAGVRRPATLSVERCDYDTSSAAPWGRAVTPPNGSRCTLHVDFTGASYPALVDPPWTTTASMATARAYPTATLLTTGKALIAGGSNGSPLATAELYDLTTHTFAATGSMTTARQDHTATLLGSAQVLVAGGYGTAVLKSAELYDPVAGHFTATGSMGYARSGHTATLLSSGKVLVAGGGLGALTAELYGAGSFTATGSMIHSRIAAAAALLPSGDVLLSGGNPGLSPPYATNTSEVYQAANGTFAASGNLTYARFEHQAITLPSGKVLVVGGWTDQGDTTNLIQVTVGAAEIYDNGTFTVTGAMNTGRMGQTASLLPTNQVLVAGGTTNTNAELYDVAGATFGPAGSLDVARSYQGAVTFPTGEVLLAGGRNGNTYLSSAELYGVPNATACTSAADCASGFCVDGYCCNSACSAQCEACDVAGSLGTCASVMSGPSHGSRTPCTCNGGECESGATCTDDHTSSGVGGVTACTPYKCDVGGSGQCKTACASVDDCTAPNVCDTTGACGPAPSSGSSGCALAPSRSSGSSSAIVWTLAALAAWVAARRRRA